MTMMAFLVLMLFPLGLAVAAISDLCTMKIPNLVSIALLAAFAVMAPLAGLGLADIGMALMAGLVVFAGCFALFALNLMGGADAKLLTVAAIWFGWNQALYEFLIGVAFFGGLVTLAFLVVRAWAPNALAIGIALPASMVSIRSIPYGIAIAISGFITFGQAPVYLAVMRGF